MLIRHCRPWKNRHLSSLPRCQSHCYQLGDWHVMPLCWGSASSASVSMPHNREWQFEVASVTFLRKAPTIWSPFDSIEGLVWAGARLPQDSGPLASSLSSMRTPTDHHPAYTRTYPLWQLAVIRIGSGICSGTVKVDGGKVEENLNRTWLKRTWEDVSYCYWIAFSPYLLVFCDSLNSQFLEVVIIFWRMVIIATWFVVPPSIVLENTNTIF